MNRNASIAQDQKKQLRFYCRIMLASHISLICSITFKLWSSAYRTFCLIHT